MSYHAPASIYSSPGTFRPVQYEVGVTPTSRVVKTWRRSVVILVVIQFGFSRTKQILQKEINISHPQT